MKHTNLELDELITIIESLYVNNPRGLFLILNLYKDKLAKYSTDTKLYECIVKILEHAIHENIEFLEVENLIRELGMKYGLLDASLDDLPVSSLRVYCTHVALHRVLWSDANLKFIFKTDEPSLLELANELEQEYNVKPEYETLDTTYHIKSEGE